MSPSESTDPWASGDGLVNRPAPGASTAPETAFTVAPYAQPAATAPRPGDQQWPAPPAAPGPAAAPYAAPTPTYFLYAPSDYAGQRMPVDAPRVADYGYRPAPPAPHPQAAASMVLGILGLVAFTPLAPVAWYLAAKARREMAAEPYRWQPSGMITAGLVTGILGTIFLGLMVLSAGFFILAVTIG